MTYVIELLQFNWTHWTGSTAMLLICVLFKFALCKENHSFPIRGVIHILCAINIVVDAINQNCLFLPVFCVYRSPGDGDMRRVPAAELCAEAGRAPGDDRHLLAADRGVLHLAVRPLRHRPPQHGVSQCRYLNTSWRITSSS